MDEHNSDVNNDSRSKSAKEPDDVNELLDELEELIEISPLPIIRHWRPFKKVFFLDIDDVLLYTRRIRTLLPLQIQKAREIVRDKDKIISDAKERASDIEAEANAQANSIIKKSQESAAALIADDTITKQATAEAQKLIKLANSESDEIRAGAMKYAQQRLEELNGSIDKLRGHLDAIQRAVEKSQQEISG